MARGIGLFFGGLAAGYVLSGFVLGPGVLAVLIGLALGTALAAILGSRCAANGTSVIPDSGMVAAPLPRVASVVCRRRSRLTERQISSGSVTRLAWGCEPSRAP